MADNIDNTTLKYNNPQNMNHSQVNKRKAKEIKNLASKGLSPQTLDSSFNKSPTKRLSRFERIECESNSAEIETFESKSKSIDFLLLISLPVQIKSCTLTIWKFAPFNVKFENFIDWIKF